METVSARLGTKPFLLRAEPASADAAIWPVIAGILVPPFESPIRQAIQRRANLIEYCERMRSRFFG